MNFKEFLDYKTNCPLCDTKLKLYYNSTSQQCHVIDGDKFHIKVPRKNFRHRIDYYLDHVFDLYSMEYNIEFYNKENVRIDRIPIDKWKALSHYASQLYMQCPKCKDFSYQANLFQKKTRYDIKLSFEEFTMNDKDNRFILQNFFINNYSKILYAKLYKGKMSPFPYPIKSFETELIPFTTKEKMVNKLQTLVTFS